MNDDEPVGDASRPEPVAKKRRTRRTVAGNAGSSGASRRSKRGDRDGESSSPDADDEGAALEAAAAATHDERPAFSLSFPQDPALDELVVAFEQGNYARVRREAPALMKSTDRPEIRDAARELARRLNPDPMATYLLIAATLLLAFLAAWYWSHPHAA